VLHGNNTIMHRFDSSLAFSWQNAVFQNEMLPTVSTQRQILTDFQNKLEICGRAQPESA